MYLEIHSADMFLYGEEDQMGWNIKCCEGCAQSSFANNIVDLLHENRDADGWFVNNICGHKGYIEKNFELQEEGETWEPFLKGAIELGDPSATYQPFVFLVSYKQDEKPESVWFSYYKDLRKDGGRLKLGYGPGGPPVLNKPSLLLLLEKLIKSDLLNKEDMHKMISET